MDIRSFVKNELKTGRLHRDSSPVSPDLQATVLLARDESFPTLLEDVRGSKLLANIMPTRPALAGLLGVSSARFLEQLSDIIGGLERRKEYGLERTDRTYGEIDVPRERWERLPILKYYEGDGGPYLTAGVWVVKDPKLGGNLSYHRLMMTGPDRGTVRVVERRGTDTALKNSGGKLEAAVCIGAPAHVLFAASLSPEMDVDELDIAAKFGKVELEKCKTVDLEVPASCEAVIEGRFTGESGDEGPFVDITGTQDIVRTQPVFEITRVASRKDPFHYTIVPGLADHKTLMGVPKELDIYREVSKVCRCLDVRVTPGGSSWLHAVVRIAKLDRDDGRKALTAAFSAHKSLKQCVVVDEDINAGSAEAVEWSLATRFQADSDLMVLKDQPSSSLDPSARHEPGKGSVGAKLGMDATIPAGADRTLFAKVPLPAEDE